MRPNTLALLALAALGCAPGGPGTEPVEESALTVAPDIEARLARFAPTELAADLSAVPSEDLEALVHLLGAARAMDEIFLRQAWAGNPNLLERIAAAGVPEAALVYYAVNFGPWDRLDEMEPFIGDRPHPPGAGYYPEDLTREELEAWIAAHPDDAEALSSLTTVVRRDGDALVAIPYSEAYGVWLDPAATALRRAAHATSSESLRRFLELRAEAFSTDDYYASDLAWMDLDSPVEATIGPYETYEDALMGYKAAFECFLTVTLPEESARLDRYKAELPWLERNLPIADEHKNLDRGTESPIRVADVVYTSGDARAGVQTLAYNLPNDERVREAKGSKKVLLKNVIRAKYDRILVPIAERVLTAGAAADVTFDAYFDEILHHELSHGLGPGKIEVDGRATEVRLELRELYSPMEEAKADVTGVWNILSLVDRGLMPEELRRTLRATYVAGLFRSARFGVHEAHGRGVLAQFNYLLERGALEVDGEGRFAPVEAKFADGIREITAELLELQATGDYDGTAAFFERYGRPTPEILGAIDRLGDVPVDIRPIYRQAEELLAR